jgi:hypothetical protein
MKCCICGAVKNVEIYLDNIFSNMEKIGSLFEDYAIILSYDKSNDKTLEKIKSYQSKNPKLILYVNKVDVSIYRTHRIAFARNICLQMIRDKYSDFEMFIMMDCDDVCSSEIKLDVLKYYLYQNTWDALSFNKLNYYDIWALAIKPYTLSYTLYKKRETILCNKIKNYIDTLLKNTNETKLLKCASAFNGFSIYRTNVFLNCNYDGRFRGDLVKNVYNIGYPVNVNVAEDCEHRSFHLEAINKNNARVRISPKILF